MSGVVRAVTLGVVLTICTLPFSWPIAIVQVVLIVAEFHWLTFVSPPDKRTQHGDRFGLVHMVLMLYAFISNPWGCGKVGG